MSVLDSFKLDGKVDLVTGASRGLGAATAVALASAGAEVALHSNEQPAEATATRIAADRGPRTALFTADLVCCSPWTSFAWPAQRVAPPERY